MESSFDRDILTGSTFLGEYFVKFLSVRSTVSSWRLLFPFLLFSFLAQFSTFEGERMTFRVGQGCLNRLSCFSLFSLNFQFILKRCTEFQIFLISYYSSLRLDFFVQKQTSPRRGSPPCGLRSNFKSSVLFVTLRSKPGVTESQKIIIIAIHFSFRKVRKCRISFLKTNEKELCVFRISYYCVTLER